MGWWTTLRIGNNEFDFSNHLPTFIPIIFYGSHHFVKEEYDLKEKEEEGWSGNFKDYTISATVSEVLENMDNCGLTKAMFVSFYESFRYGMIIQTEAFVSSIKEINEKLRDVNIKSPISISDPRLVGFCKSILEQIRSSNSKSDIEILISSLRNGEYLNDEHQIEGYNYIAIPTITEIDNLSFFSQSPKAKIGLIGEFFDQMTSQLPEIIDLFELRLILESKESEEFVSLDLTDYENQDFGADFVIEHAKDALESKVLAYRIAFDTLISDDSASKPEFVRSKIFNSLITINKREGTNFEKGRSLESLLVDLFTSINGLELVTTNLLLETQELDIVIKNKSTNQFYINLHRPFFFIESKNWNSKVGVVEIRGFESKIRQNKKNLGIFVSLNGFTEPCYTHVDSLRREGIEIVLISGVEIDNIVEDLAFDTENWLENIISLQTIRSL